MSEKYYHWLVSEIGYNTTYHNHKEMMAWVATALFIPGVIALAFYTKSCQFIVLLTLLVGAFVCEQFRLRSRAADTVAALMKLVNDFCKDPNFTPVDKDIPQGKHKLWPKFVDDEIEKFKGKGRTCEAKWGTDAVTYLAIVVVMGIAIYLATN